MGSFKPNQFGLYDLSGNVWEWCEDWVDDKKNYRVLRGGSLFYYIVILLQSSSRLNRTPDLRVSHYGFRCVLVGSAS